jgi:hypothetical protein
MTEKESATSDLLSSFGVFAIARNHPALRKTVEKHPRHLARRQGYRGRAKNNYEGCVPTDIDGIKLLMGPAPAPWRWPVKRDRSPETVGGLLQSSVFAISLHPVFAHVVFAQDLAGLLRKAPVSASLRLIAALRWLRPMRRGDAVWSDVAFGSQSGRPLFMGRSRRDCRWQDRDRGPPAPD